jgi:hypothetical protein
MYQIEIHSPEGPPATSPLIARSSPEAYRMILTRMNRRAGVRVTHAEHGQLRLRVNESQAWVAIDEAAARDPSASADETPVELLDETGATVSVPMDRTITRDRALVALADWLDGGQRTELLAWG